MTWNANDYVDVAERIRVFKAEFPTGSLQSYVPPFVQEVDGKSFVVYGAAAYRTPDDDRPGIGWAWEPVPGPTNFTKDSELQNAETSAWGRAIVALGFETKKIASVEEVRNRNGDSPEASFVDQAHRAQLTNPQPDDIEVTFGAHKGKMLRDVPSGYKRWLAGEEFDPKTPAQYAVKAEAQKQLGLVAVGGGPMPDDDIPFEMSWA